MAQWGNVGDDGDGYDDPGPRVERERCPLITREHHGRHVHTHARLGCGSAIGTSKWQQLLPVRLGESKDSNAEPRVPQNPSLDLDEGTPFGLVLLTFGRLFGCSWQFVPR